MAVTGWKTPGTCASVDRDGKTTWNNPDYAKVSDEDRADNHVNKNTYSDWLRCTNFGFTTSDIPSGATIDGIEVKIEHRSQVSDMINDSALYLRDGVGQAGDNKASAAYWPYEEAEAFYGGAADDWNAGLDDSEIRDTTFGVDLSAACGDSVGGQYAFVDCVSIRVYYTPAGALAVEPSPVAASSSVQSPSASGSGVAPISLSPVQALSAVVAPVVGAAAAPQSIDAPPVAATSAIQSPAIAGSGSAPVSPSPVQAASAINAPKMGRHISLIAVDSVSQVQAPVVSGSGAATISPSPAAISSSVQAPSVTPGPGAASISPSPVAAPSAVQAPSVAGTGVAPVSPSPVAAPSSVQAPALSGSGVASISPSPVAVASSVAAPEARTSQCIELPSVATASSVQSPAVTMICRPRREVAFEL